MSQRFTGIDYLDDLAPARVLWFTREGRIQASFGKVDGLDMNKITIGVKMLQQGSSGLLPGRELHVEVKVIIF